MMASGSQTSRRTQRRHWSCESIRPSSALAAAEAASKQLFGVRKAASAEKDRGFLESTQQALAAAAARVGRSELADVAKAEQVFKAMSDAEQKATAAATAAQAAATQATAAKSCGGQGGFAEKAAVEKTGLRTGFSYAAARSRGWEGCGRSRHAG